MGKPNDPPQPLPFAALPDACSGVGLWVRGVLGSWEMKCLLSAASGALASEGILTILGTETGFGLILAGVFLFFGTLND
jgi:hypothetical protein